MNRRETFDPDEVELARAVPIEGEIARRGINLSGKGPERVGPCPKCGGTDRFSINTKKQGFNCRGCQTGGGVIELVKFLDDCDHREAVRRLVGKPARNKKPLVDWKHGIRVSRPRWERQPDTPSCCPCCAAPTATRNRHRNL
jgi:DNA primase